MVINSQLFEAYLKCATKCYLKATGEAGAGNAYAEWLNAQNEAYRNDGIKRLITEETQAVCINSPTELKNIKTTKWRLALNFVAEAQNLESTIHAVERVSSRGKGKPAQFIPVRFVFTNKITKNDKLLLAFDTFVLSKSLGRKINLGKIIQGDKHNELKAKVSSFASGVEKTIEKTLKLIAMELPPDFMLNKHCPECEFEDQCRKKAIEKDELSLLARMSEKERKKLKNKGIFTITQLSYTFRPRRRPRRLKNKPEKYHHSLKALAIREKKIHIVGSPELKIEGTPVYLDVEGLPDRDFYYLIGMRIGNGESAVQHSLWADTIEEEEKIWREFFVVLETIEKPVLVHYGSYETTFLKRMCERYGEPSECSIIAKVIEAAVNILSLIYARFYFPTYSNSLKDVATCLNFQWFDARALGARSVIVRSEWEQSGDLKSKEWLRRYNTEDCNALEIVASSLLCICGPQGSPEDNYFKISDMVKVDSLKPQLPFYFGKKVSVTPDLDFLRKAAYWNYQRDRIYFRPLGRRKDRPRKVLANCRATSLRINKVIVHEVSPECPNCKRISTKPKVTRVRILYDLCFGHYSIKSWVVKHIYQTYFCWRCHLIFGLDKRFKKPLRFGWNVVAYFLYQVIQLTIPQRIVTQSLNQLFGFSLRPSTTHKFKSSAAKSYKETQRQILTRLVSGSLIHADETKANVKGQLAYVWVFTNLREVVYLYADTREADMLHATLAGFKGVLVSDFYAAYDSIDCPQQKCLTHLLRDLNDGVLEYPYDEELKELVKSFGALVRPMVETVDRYGLKQHFLGKHRKLVDRFYKELGKASYHSEAALKYKDRFEKNRQKLFTFPDYDGVPWNNNNAEHAIKAYAALRNVMEGTSTRAGIEEYLILLSICETCKYKSLDFFDFLRSGEKDIDVFAQRKAKRKITSPTG